jgi:hypothetical protein
MEIGKTSNPSKCKFPRARSSARKRGVAPPQPCGSEVGAQRARPGVKEEPGPEPEKPHIPNRGILGPCAQDQMNEPDLLESGKRSPILPYFQPCGLLVCRAWAGMVSFGCCLPQTPHSCWKRWES